MGVGDLKYQEILDYISDELTEKKREEFEVWLSNSDDNQNEYRQILRKVLFTQWGLKYSTLDTNKEFNKFEKRLNKQVHNLIYIAVAASVILLLSIALPYLREYSDVTDESIAQTISIEPGTRGAELILSSGERINIDENSQEIKETDGSLIQIDSTCGLEYKAEQKQNQKEIYNTLKVARGQEFDILLVDGTRVWLNAESELRYPVQFTGENRQVYLKGEAYFEVHPDKEKAFLVNSYKQQVKVYGTEFCVDAYNQNKIKTVLVEGVVGVRAVKGGVESKLQANQLALSDAQKGQVQIKKVNVRPYIAWKDGDFVFENEILEDIMLRLERWYNVKVFYKNEETKKYRFTGDIKRYSEVGDLLYYIETTSNVKFEIKDQLVIVMNK